MDVRDVERAISGVNQVIRARLLQLPAKVAGAWTTEERNKLRLLLDKEVREILTELADPETVSFLEQVQ